MARYLKIVLFVISLSCTISCWADDEEQLVLDWELKQAAQGDPVSQFFVAETFRYGRGVPVNTDQAITYYKKAAKQGYVEANMALGTMYEEKDLAAALRYYEAAAKDTYVPAMLKLGEIYKAERQYRVAYDWYEKAMKILFPDTQDLTTVSPAMKELKQLIHAQ